jgi:hypothetical protein
MSRALTAAAVLAVSVSAAQAGVVKGKCDGDKCDAFEVVEQSAVKTDAVHGEGLILARIKSWVQDGEKRNGETEETGYVFCSKTRPAMLIQDNGKTLVKFLAPAAKADVEKNINLYASYYEVCHSKGAEVAQGLDELAKQLDYKVSRTDSSELKQANKPESVFWWTTPDVKVARPVFVNEPTKTAAKQPDRSADEPRTTGSIKEPTTTGSIAHSPRSVAPVDPHRSERIAMAKARAEAQRVAAIKARDRYAAAARRKQQQYTSGTREAVADAEPEQRVIYVRQEPRGFFDSLFGGGD